MSQYTFPKIDLMMSILKQLDSGALVTAAGLAEEFSVTERSIYRYLETLQGAGYPIYFDRKMKSYRFAEPYKLHNQGSSKEVLAALELRQQMLRSSSVGIAAYNVDGSCVLVNTAMTKMLEASKQQILAQSFNNIEAWSASGLRPLIIDVIKDGNERSADLCLTSSSGKELWAHCIVTPFCSNGEKFIVVMASDISNRKKNELALSTFVSSITKGPTLLVITDVDGTIEYVSDKITQVTGYTSGEVLGKNPKIFQSGLTPESVYKNMWETIKGGMEWTGELFNRRKGGSTYWEHIRISPIFDSKNNIKRFVSMKEDVTMHKQLEDELYRHATSDSLTTLYNKRMTIELANREFEIARRHNEPVAVIMVDIYQMKKINDEFGHEVGDELIKAVAAGCQKVIRKSDIIGRVGDDSFAILVTGVDGKKTLETAERIITSIKETKIVVGGIDIPFAVSIGIATFSDVTNHESSFDSLLHSAELGCIKAMQEGKNKIVCFSP